MGVIGRFAELSPSKFNPLSLDEIMAVPLYKQQQHDKLVADNESLYKSLIVDPLDVHKDEAEKLKKDFENKLDAQALQLAKYGIDQNSKSEFLKTKREYDKLVSPTGRIGQINNAKKVYLDNFKEYIEDATKNKGWSREKALENWTNKFANKYTGYNENKDIVNIGNYGAPKKIEVNDKLKFAKDILGEQVINEARASGYKLIPQSDGSMVFADSKGRRIETSNKPNLQHALNLLNQQMQDPEWRSSIDFEGVNPESVRSQIGSGINAMLSNKVVDNRTTDYAYHAKPKGDGEDDNMGFGLTVASENFAPEKYAGKSYSDITNIIAGYKGKNLNEAQRQELAEARTFKKSLDKKLQSNPQFVKLNKQLEAAEKEFQDQMNNPGKNLRGTTEQSRNVERQINDKKALEKINNIKSQIDKITKNTIQKNNIESTDYMLTPTTKKQQGILEVANNNFEQLFKQQPENIKAMVNIENVYNGDKVFSKLTPADKDGIAKVLYNSKPGSVTLQRVSRKGFSGKPEYVLRVTTDEDNEYNLNGPKFGNDDIGGKGKSFDIRVSFNKSHNNVPVNNINGLVKQYVGSAGEKGQQLAKDMSLYETYGNRTWKESKSAPEVQDRIDDLIEADMLNNKNSVYSRFKSHEAMVNYFLTHNGDEFVNFDDN